VKAIVQHAYGAPADVLSLEDVPVPRVGDDDVLVRVAATAVHADVWHVVTGWPLVARVMGNGVRTPKTAHRIPGVDLAGTVERVGAHVTTFAPGDDVFGGLTLTEGWRNGGTYAEHAVMPYDHLAIKPPRATFEQAAAAWFASVIALPNMGRLDALAGRHVLINGAGGGVGTIAVQIAKSAGAEVTGVDSEDKLAVVRQLGADHTIDLRHEDVTRGGVRYDFIFDVASTLTAGGCANILTPRAPFVGLGHTDYGRVGGRLLGTIPQMGARMLKAPFDPHMPAFARLPSRQSMLETVSRLLESGALTPVVARTFPLADTHAAFAELVEGSVVGRLVLIPNVVSA
jgi:NADPH:quinone reductase-like Zn-dependent oxidoreductase